MAFLKKKVGRQGTWPSALLLLVAPVLLILSFRWILFEPFVIPSTSMVPSLLIHDHILVKKYSYGLRMPFTEDWLFQYANPHRGDIVVFKYPANPKVFFVKRVIGLPGDRVSVQNGQVTVNDKPWILRQFSSDEETDSADFNYFIESIPYEQTKAAEEADKVVRNQGQLVASVSETQSLHEERFKQMLEEDVQRQVLEIESQDHIVRLYSKQDHVDPSLQNFIVPPNSYFMMGDNRDQSHDSRFWGFVPAHLLIGPASFIWLSCENTLATAPMICDPALLRLSRMFKKVN